MKYELEPCEECGSRNVEMQVGTCDCFIVCFDCGNSSDHYDNELDAAQDWNGGITVGYIERKEDESNE